MSANKSIINKVMPLQKGDLAKFFCASGLILFITYIAVVLKISKDALVISHLGTETISAIKIGAVLPISLAFMFVYIKLSDVLSRSRLFHCMNWFFILYFAVFAFVLYPYREELSINISDEVIASLPAFKYLFKVISNWHYSLFYVFAESWMTIMLSISFWQTANHITNFEESKRFYPLLGVIAQIGMAMAGVLSKVCVVEGASWQSTLNNVTVSIVVAGLALSLCLIALEKVVGVNIFNMKKTHFKAKAKISLKESIKYVASSKPILLITALLLCYNISINLVEGVWKKSIEVLYSGNANQIHHFMSDVNIYISIASAVVAIAGVYIVRSCKWRTSALITPIAALVTGAAFFLFMVLRDTAYLLALQGAIQTSAIALAVYFGATNNIFARSTKHTLFDSTKEMVYIPLDDDLKTKGKAAAETIGMRFGKGSGAFITQILLGLFPALTLLDLSPIIFGMFLVILVCWIYSTVSLSRILKN